MALAGWTYREVSAPQQFVRTFGRRTAIVARLDGSTWGFTLWHNGECLAGWANWNWTPEDAAAQAESVNATIPD